VRDKSSITISPRNVIFLDVETNGLSGHSSVLSVTAIKALFNGNNIDTIEDVFTRFYFRNPGERANPEAIKVNGLRDEAIRKMRGNAKYAEHFNGDGDFAAFCAGVNHYVGHNISFDRMFIHFPLKHCFCTMKENTKIIRIKGHNAGFKYPRLSEAAAYYGLSPESGKLHGSEYDTRLTYEIFRKMLGDPRTKQRVLAFLGK
jgi:DNA polymerase III epsilon subunit-like protein